LKQFALDSVFKKKKLLCIAGCGSTPGISNVLAAYAVEQLDSVDTITLGFAWDSNIKQFVVPYSMESIFDEFTQPPITAHNGKFLKEERFTCQGTFDFRAVGKQTAYCIVHSEVLTFMRYFRKKHLKNVQYLAGFPEHSMRVIRTLIDLGFQSRTPVQIGKNKVLPLDVTLNVLKRLPVPKGYREVENLWVQIEGERSGKKIRTEMNCIIETLPGWEAAGSNVDTGRTIAVISQMIHKGEIRASGVHAPEGVVPQEPFFQELAKRKMFVYRDGKKIN